MIDDVIASIFRGERLSNMKLLDSRNDALYSFVEFLGDKSAKCHTG